MKNQSPHFQALFISFYDDFTDFNNECAFLCDAFSSLVNRHEFLNEQSIQGLERHADFLKNKMNVFKKRLAEMKIAGLINNEIIKQEEN